MKEALSFQNDKSDKFWRIETNDTFMVTNWGKSGTNGRWQLSEFYSSEECEKEAAKLISSKRKKGYLAIRDFDYDGRIYFDCEEYGPNPLTSHPIFRKYFFSDFYYDCADEDSPFGSDTGSDTLALLQDQYTPKLDFVAFPQKLMIQEWEMDYLAPDNAQTDEEMKTQIVCNTGDFPTEDQMRMSDQIILATALGQIKMTGSIKKELLKIAYASLNRWQRLCQLEEEQTPHTIGVMRSDLERFEKEHQERTL